MATLNVQTETTEQSPTLESGVDISQRNQAVEEATLDSRREQETLTVEHGVRTESDALQQSVTSRSQQPTLEQGLGTGTRSQTIEQGLQTQEQTPKTLSDREISKIVDSITLKIVANEWIEKCEDLRSWIQATEWSNRSRRELREKIQRWIKDMKKMVEDINRFERRWQVYSNTDRYKDRLWEIIFDYYSSWEPARQIIVMWWRVPMIRWTVDSRRDARKDNNYAEDNAEYQIDFSELKKNTAIYNMIWVSASEWWDYCDFVWQWWIAMGHPVYVQHKAGFDNINMYNPDLYRALTPGWQITYGTYCQRNPQLYEAYCRNNNIVCAPQSYNRRFWNRFANMMEQIFPERMYWDPRQRQAWSNIWSLLAIWWTIFMWFKALQSLKKDDKWNRNWWGFAWWAAWTLALLNADTVINTIQDAFNWHPAEKSRIVSEAFRKYGFPDETARDMADRYIWAPVTTMSALHFIPIYELESQHILEDRNGEFEFNYANYEKYINQLRRTKDQKDQVLEAWKKLDKDKSVWAWLKAFWIATWEKLRSLFWSDKNKTLADTDEVKNWWENLERRVSSWVNAELFKNWLRVKDPEKVDAIIKEYEEKKDNTRMNELILKWMKDGLLEFNDNREYTLNEMVENQNIDLEKMTIKWFKSWTNEVQFSTYKELFDTYFLTEKIKYKFEWVPAKSNEPFKINSLWQLKFDDKNWYEFFSSDTTVISRKTFTNDFPTLKEYRDDYARYLNERRQGKNLVDISSLDIVSQLWINFYSEQEARELNTTLRRIKDDLRYYHPTKYGDPFEIKDGVLKIKIEFTTVWESKKTWDISWLKTFSSEANKEKLLKYLNDKTNKMWWSSL